jgi:predicted amidohydrolase
MKLCAAQLSLEAGKIDRNIRKHVAWVDVAVSHQADLIYFPELSLTGYEPKLAKDLATDANDHRLDVFQELADGGNIAIGVGLPTRFPDGIRVAMVVFRPRSERLTYAKQQLHSDELPFFVKGEQQLIIPMSGHALAPAICYESLQSNHADTAARSGADIYFASVAKPQRNVTKAYEHYAQIAKNHSIAVLMANSVGPSDNFVSAGQSAAWNSLGQLVVHMDDKAEGFVIFNTSVQEGVVVLI